MGPKGIHTVVFDLDDTLYPEADYVFSGFRAVDQFVIQELGLFGFFDEAVDLFRFGSRGRIFDQVIGKLGAGRVPLGIVPRLVEVYRSHEPVLRLFPDAEAMLTAPIPRWRLGLLSDGYLSVQKRKLEALGLMRSFGSIVLTDAFGRAAWKPSLVGFSKIMDDLPGVASGYVYVADNPRKDFIAPRALGWATVRIRRRGCEHSEYEPLMHEAADVEISGLGELAGVLS